MSKYKDEGGTKLTLPKDVRWNSYTDCFESYIKAWPTLFNICEKYPNKIKKEIVENISNISLKRDVENHLKIFKTNINCFR